MNLYIRGRQRAIIKVNGFDLPWRCWKLLVTICNMVSSPLLRAKQSEFLLRYSFAMMECA